MERARFAHTHGILPERGAPVAVAPLVALPAAAAAALINVFVTVLVQRDPPQVAARDHAQAAVGRR